MRTPHVGHGRHQHRRGCAAVTGGDMSQEPGVPSIKMHAAPAAIVAAHSSTTARTCGAAYAAIGTVTLRLSR